MGRFAALSVALFLSAAGMGAAQRPTLIPQIGHAGTIHSIAFSPDGKLLASGENGQRVIVWDVAVGRQLRTLIGDIGGVNEVAFSPDNKTLAIGKVIAPLTLWDVTTGQELQKLGTGADVFTFSPDGKSLASNVGFGEEIKFWDVATGRELRTLQGLADQATSLVFSADGEFLAGGDTKGNVILWAVARGMEVRRLRGQLGNITALAFRPDSRTLAVSEVFGNASALMFAEVATGQELRRLKPGGTSLSFSADGKLLAVSVISRLAVLEVATGLPVPGSDRWSYVPSSNVAAFSPREQILAADGYRGISLVNAATGKELRRLQGIRSGLINSTGAKF